MHVPAAADEGRRRSALALALFVLVSVAGLAALPVTLDGGGASPSVPAGGSARLEDTIWLFGALAAALFLVVLAPGLSRTLARGLARRWPASASPEDRADAQALARFILAGVSIVLIQTILRAPFVRVIGASSRLDTYLVEACFATAAFLLLVLVITSIYRVVYPLLEALVSAGLDATVATTTSEAATRAADTVAPSTHETLAAPTPVRGRVAETRTDPSRTL